jgi:hypothetical protein
MIRECGAPHWNEVIRNDNQIIRNDLTRARPGSSVFDYSGLNIPVASVCACT